MYSWLRTVHTDDYHPLVIKYLMNFLILLLGWSWKLRDDQTKSGRRTASVQHLERSER